MNPSRKSEVINGTLFDTGQAVLLAKHSKTDSVASGWSSAKRWRKTVETYLYRGNGGTYFWREITRRAEGNRTDFLSPAGAEEAMEFYSAPSAVQYEAWEAAFPDRQLPVA